MYSFKPLPFIVAERQKPENQKEGEGVDRIIDGQKASKARPELACSRRRALPRKGIDGGSEKSKKRGSSEGRRSALPS